MPNVLPNNKPAVQSTRVLLVDDDSLSRSILRNMLRLEGYEAIREASKADAGLAMAEHFEPELICLDIQMPGRSGVEVIGELKALLPGVAVLMVTSSNDAATVKACLEEQADGYLIKPFSAGTLLKTIEIALAKARAREPRAAQPAD